MKKLKLVLLFTYLFGLVQAQNSLLDQFQTPPSEAKPWTIWYWMRGAVSKEGIKADLEAMSSIGLGGAYLMPIRGIEGSNYPKPVNQLTPEWWEMVRYSMEQADRLDLKLGMHISDGFALAGGPWIKPSESMQKLVFSDTIIKGGKTGKFKLTQPETIENYYQDIAILALPISKSNVKERNSTKSEFTITSNNPEDPNPFSENGKAFRSVKPCFIQYNYKSPFTLRSIEIAPAGNNIQSQRFTVLSSNDGVNFNLVKQLTPPRQGWQNAGFNTTFSVQPTQAKYFRLAWTPEGSEPGSEDLDAAKWRPTLKVNAIKLSNETRINGWEGKSGLVWRIADQTSTNEISTTDCTPENTIINLTNHFKNGQLNYKLPKGNWRILRMGHTSTGHTNATGGGGKGLECDKFSALAVQKQFDNWFGAAFAKTDSALAHRVLKLMHIDSWECGSQNWSSNFAKEFQVRRGYDLIPFLPILAGYPVESIQKSEQILHDVRITIDELVHDVFFKVMVRNAKTYGCETSSECIAPTFVSDGLKHFGEVDRPMGEFWLNSPTHDKLNDMLDAISGAHIYEKKIIQAEGFTQLRTNWNEHPAMLKSLLDYNFALGINKLFFHVSVHNPYLDKSPGTTLDGIGLYFQRDQTWWKQGKSFVDYIARCQALLQFGKPVVDIAVFNGEEIPNRALTPDKLVPLLPGIMGEKQVESERTRLKNEGQPMFEMPAGVFHSANILKPEDWINPLNGYAYDSFNKDVLINLDKLSTYKVLIFPNGDNYSKETIAKIQELKNSGIAIPNLPVLSNKFDIEPDVMLPANIAWTHRTDGNIDVYFLSNQENSEKKFEVSFRMNNGAPQLWNPVNGEIYQPEKHELKNGRTEVSLTLNKYESVFVVFGYTETTSFAEHFKDKNSLNKKVLNLKWDLLFHNNNQTVKTDTLIDWSKNENPLIKYYSGTATYKTTFNFKEPLSKTTKLNLGKVCNLATVKLNGIICATIWTTPYEIDITKALKNGQNTLEIEVTNTWANAINGSDKGFPPFEGVWTDGKYRMKEDKLLEAGLLGPISIIQK